MNCFQITILVEDSQGIVTFNSEHIVVNCFQITILVEDSQAKSIYPVQENSCELLSDYYFSRGFTG